VAAPTPYPAWMNPRADDVFLDVVVAPRASRTRVMGVHDDRLKIQVAAPPVEGKANEVLVRFLADTLGIAKAQVDIVGGTSSKRKTVRLAGVPPHLVLLKLSPPA
jgi:uncharacterized protein